MDEFIFYARIFVYAGLALVLGLWLYGISSHFDSYGDFFRTLIDREYNYLSFVFRKGKHIRFITEFPKDLRKACLGKNSYYFDKPKDTPSKRRAKLLVRRVLANDSLINEYLTGNYFTYEEFLALKEVCNLPNYDETSQLLDELSSHLRYPSYVGVIKELIIELMTDEQVDFKAGKREAALLKAFNRSAATKVPWEQNDFVNFMVKLGINCGKYKGVHESTVGTYSKQINKDDDERLYRYVLEVEKMIDQKIQQFMAKS